ncbi:MAG: DUF3124 domain-containing protein [Dehalococcoidales bacterium]|nr:DUF3124 domain-containing protein [Dehalococcoidales bacterium]
MAKVRRSHNNPGLTSAGEEAFTKTVLRVLSFIIIVPLAVLGCRGETERPLEEGPIQGGYQVETQAPDRSRYVDGEILYVPIYSSIFHYTESRTYELASTLSVHNIDLNNPIKVVRADYFDTNGGMIRAYVTDTLVLKPLQTVQIVIREDDKSGGTGANFIVEWASESEVASPIVEAVMISTSGQQGISFTAAGRVIERTYGK